MDNNQQKERFINPVPILAALIPIFVIELITQVLTLKHNHYYGFEPES